MNISEIKTPSFKGYLDIQHKNGRNFFNTDNIKKIIKNDKSGGVFLEGKDISGKYIKMHVPYYTMRPDKVIAAYKAACYMGNGVLVLKLKDKCLVKSC